ncbi:MAG TPA: lipocalin family protein [Candidatus Kapabacteria bacterium]
MKKVLLLLIAIMMLSSCGSDYPHLKTVDKVDVNKYMGTWYEIVRLPNSFEKGLECVTATYSLKENGDVKVTNRGRNVDNHSKIDEANATAWVVDTASNSKLKVRFFWPFTGDYWIIALDKDYQYVMVGTPSREYLWILSRESKLDESVTKSLLDSASRAGFDVSKIERVKQDCH